LAAELLPEVDSTPAGSPLAALGGGRVVDVAKALAAARPPRPVIAIPTTLSAAEMTRIHRHASGIPADTPRVRPQVVVNDPALSASQPPADLAASSANALGHAVEGPLTIRSSPVPRLAGEEAARLIRVAWEGDEPDRDALALAALLSGYSIDAAGYGLHHVCSQTLVRVCGIGHGPANAAMLPHTIAALRARAGDRVLAGAEDLAAMLAERAGAVRLRELGVSEDQLDVCAATASERAELDLIPPRAERAELRDLYQRAF
jgi:alcohol dehydrogenase class IV